jgi:predicted O-methyltransferase YrrM
MSPASTAWSDLVAAYTNTAEHNDRVHRELTARTWADPMLAAHRRHVEENRLGFGDPAFHAMWAALIEAAAARFGEVRALEIGVFKGQVISLWSLLARERGLRLRISALSPLAGQPMPHGSFLRRLRYRLDRRFRERVDNGDFYAAEDYERIIGAHFAHHGLRLEAVQLHRGYSTDPALLAALRVETYHLVYVDGDHTLAGSRHDFLTFGPKVVPGGWLVADDAGCDLPGTVFWKGHRAVSDAVNLLPGLGFTNVLNVGHNRVYERNSA